MRQNKIGVSNNRVGEIEIPKSNEYLLFKKRILSVKHLMTQTHFLKDYKKDTSDQIGGKNGDTTTDKEVIKNKAHIHNYVTMVLMVELLN
jgi:hypothetical protein